MSTTLPGRLARLLTGLVLFGVSVALMVRADLGLASWDVLHQGLAERTGLPLGQVVNLVAVAVLLLWIPLRQRPGVGTLANAVVVGFAADAALVVLPPVPSVAGRIGLLVAGILLNGLATALYLGARLGPGPRDGLMTGLAARGLPIGRVRTAIELGVLALGWALGGTVGPGTVLFAVSIGPLAQYLIPKFTVPAQSRPATTGVTSPCPA
ncbi:YczE/YyaS/YitT family protein [Micromonospora echinaurantiaca]|uniref:membrane protein YczE n=1 Tax=Micromonospora echinaurantiaca TaxID=47857 RepID=UPI00343AA5C7